MTRDPVTPELHDFVLRRDGQCVAALLDRSHICKDRWAHEHRPDTIGLLTLEHVKDEPMMGKRAPSDSTHLVAMCFDANAVSMWASANRGQLRIYLLGVAAQEQVA